MNVLDVKDLTKTFGPTCLFDHISFALEEGSKVGLIGRNGCGKSTLFKILAGTADSDSGTVARKRGLTVGYLEQKPTFNPESTIRSVLEGYLGESRAKLGRHGEIARELAGAEGEQLNRLLLEQEEVHGWLDHHSAWNLNHRVEEICTRFAIANPEARIGSLSGGWNQRVALAGMLLSQPELLLLDEPTNQLDAETVEWLETHLLEYPGAVLLVTHDRYFLDRVVSRMFELSSSNLYTYTGGYSSYLEEKAQRLLVEEKSQSRLANLLRREEEWLKRGPKARTTKQKARIDRVADLRDAKAPPPGPEMSLGFKASKSLGHTVIETSGLSMALGGKKLFGNLDFILRKGERVGILGPNGCGKTTLLKSLLGELPPTSGTVTIGKHTQVAYLDQGRTGLPDDLAVDEVFGPDDWVMVGGPKGEKRHKSGYLESFLFTRADHKKPVGTLSGGERARLLLALILLKGANVLVLDEPTNDLDIPSLQVLDEALSEFAGSVLMVTHDRYFLDRVATGILHFEPDQKDPSETLVIYYEGNYEVFTRLRALNTAEEKAAKKTIQKPVEQKSRQVSPKGLNYKEKKRLVEVEEEIAALEEQKSVIEATLADPGKAGADHGRIAQLSEEFNSVNHRLEELMAEWESLEEKKL